MSTPSKEELIEWLDLEPHPEGGYFRETWRTKQTVPGEALEDYPGDREAATSIVYLLPSGVSSRLHRIKSEELWLYQVGDPVELTLRPTREADGQTTVLSPNHSLQAPVPANWWQQARPLDGPAGYGLVACIVAPGFEFEDFEMQ